MTHVEVAIVGAGFAGIGMAMALRRGGHESFVLLERAESVGCTWRDNTYPGIACDVPAHLYGFAAQPHAGWSHLFARGADLHNYLQNVVGKEGFGDRVQLDSPMQSARWVTNHWVIQVAGPTPRTLTADVLVVACGRLTEPAIPAISGLESFDGPLFHTARWDHTADLAGLRVGVVGTGASAIQVVPELARTAAHVTLFQRSPAWIMPRGDRPYTAAERRMLAKNPEKLAALRGALYAEGEARFASRSGDAVAGAAAQKTALTHLHAQVADPALRAQLTPDYAFGCKRVLLSDNFYPALASPSVTLEPTALAAVEGNTLTSAGGTRHDVDALVLATGFVTQHQPYAELIVGDGDRTLAEHWSGGMTSFGSTVVPGFANMFVLDGPNASLGHNSSVLMLEEQAAYVVRALALRDTRADGVLRARAAAEREYTAEVDRAARHTPWLVGGCENWYTEDGRLTLLWPGTVDAFRARLAAADGSEFVPELLGPAAGPAPTKNYQQERGSR